jgi:purine-nucleoside phosphorylase
MVKIQDSKKDLKQKIGEIEADIAITLGSGLGSFTEVIDVQESVSYSDIEGLQTSTVDGHEGEFIFGEVNGTKIVAMNGRVHYYETGDMSMVVKPIRLLSSVGIERLILTNAAGGVNESYNPGDVMIIEDHINNMGDNPLIGNHKDSFGLRFPDMTYAYSPDLRKVAKEEADKTNLRVQEGVYVANSGPTYETPAEVKMVRKIGGDAVGMSTVPECIVANQEGMSVVGVSVITNYAAGVTEDTLSHEEVKETAEAIEEDMNTFVSNLIKNINSS